MNSMKGWKAEKRTESYPNQYENDVKDATRCEQREKNDQRIAQNDVRRWKQCKKTWRNMMKMTEKSKKVAGRLKWSKNDIKETKMCSFDSAKVQKQTKNNDIMTIYHAFL